VEWESAGRGFVEPSRRFPSGNARERRRRRSRAGGAAVGQATLHDELVARGDTFSPARARSLGSTTRCPSPRHVT
jgi:hypothetical protein